MKINNIVFDVIPNIDSKYNKIIIPYPIIGDKIVKNGLLNYINNFITIDKNNMNSKIINDIENKINKTKKNKINLSLVIQNKQQYYKIIIMVIKFKNNIFYSKKLNNSLELDTIESRQYLGEFYEFFRLLGSTCISRLNNSEMYKVNLCLPNFKALNIKINTRLEAYINFAFIEGMILTMYSFKKYKNKDNHDNDNDIKSTNK